VCLTLGETRSNPRRPKHWQKNDEFLNRKLNQEGLQDDTLSSTARVSGRCMCFNRGRVGSPPANPTHRVQASRLTDRVSRFYIEGRDTLNERHESAVDLGHRGSKNRRVLSLPRKRQACLQRVKSRSIGCGKRRSAGGGLTHQSHILQIMAC